jgi:hypothetical protein
MRGRSCFLLLLIKTQFIQTSKKQDLTPLFALDWLLTTLYGENKISREVKKALLLERRIVNVSRK